MARLQCSPTGTVQRVLHVQNPMCPECGKVMWSAYVSVRTVRTLQGVHGLRLHVRFCVNKACGRDHVPYHPEEEGRLALPQYEFGLDVIALVGALRYQAHRSVPEIHQELAGRGLVICERSVTNLLDRYDELLALRLVDSKRLQRITARQKRVILSLDGLQPDAGHGTSGTAGRRTEVGNSALPQGHGQLHARAVPLLSCPRFAANQQCLGATVRLDTPS